MSEQPIEARMQRFKDVCREKAVKLTHQRWEIYREVAQTAEHPDAERIFQGVRERMPTVSLDTVYRTLWWLKDMGLITVLGPTRERTRFDANLSHHHHFVCSLCGLTRDFSSEVLDHLELPDTIQSIGQVQQTQVEVKGVCFDCAAS